MRVTHLSLTNFRSYAEAAIDLGPGVTTLVGRNGQGKTNVVEAIHYLSTLSSHRVASDQPLILAGQTSATVRAKVEKSGRSLGVEITINAGRANAARLNRGAARPRDVAGILRTVVFAPEDLELVKGDPGARRRFIDALAVQLQPTLAGDISDYERVVRQRSTLLKTARGKAADLSTLDVWDDKLCQLGGRIVAARVEALRQLAPHVRAAYADIAPESAECAVAYDPQLLTAEQAGATAAHVTASLQAQVVELRPKELDRGVCLVGPHRDDVSIAIGELPAKGYASHGESWSCALALRLGSFDALTADGGPDSDADGEPVLILDDVFAELDSGRRAALTARVARADQVLITAAVREDVPAELGGDVLTVAAGTVKRDD